MAPKSKKAAAPEPAPEPAKRNLKKIPKAVISSKDDKTLSFGSSGEGSGMVLKEWMRLPKTLLQEHCQRNKAPKPEYYSSQRGGEHFCRVRLPDGKDKAKDSHFSAPVGGPSAQDAQHTAAPKV